jgi:hypothetical protein
MDLANGVRGLLKIIGIRLPKAVKNGSFGGVVRPMIEIDDVSTHALGPLLDARVVLSTSSGAGSASQTRRQSG